MRSSGFFLIFLANLLRLYLYIYIFFFLLIIKMMLANFSSLAPPLKGRPFVLISSFFSAKPKAVEGT